MQEDDVIKIPPRERKETETSILRRVLRDVNRIPHVRAMRNNVGKSPVACSACRRHLCPRCAPRLSYPIPFGLGEGSPDVVGIITFWRLGVPIAVSFGIEVKKPGGRTSRERLETQAAWRRFGDQRGMRCAVVHHEDGAVAFVIDTRERLLKVLA